MKGIILDPDSCTLSMRRIMSEISRSVKGYHWLVSNYECYPSDAKSQEILSKEYCWLSTEELMDIILSEEFQWIWGVLSGFPSNIEEAKALEYPLPFADGYEGFWINPLSLQNPMAEVEVVAWDGILMLAIGRDDLIDKLQEKILTAEDLEKYNKS